jgi:hypothetical protein
MIFRTRVGSPLFTTLFCIHIKALSQTPSKRKLTLLSQRKSQKQSADTILARYKPDKSVRLTAHSLMTASVVHVTDLTPGSEWQPYARASMIYQSRSRDGGKTWGTASPLGRPSMVEAVQVECSRPIA